MFTRRIYILINWLGLKGLKSDSLIWVLDVFAIAFRIYPGGPLILYLLSSFIFIFSVVNLLQTEYNSTLDFPPTIHTEKSLNDRCIKCIPLLFYAY